MKIEFTIEAVVAILTVTASVILLVTSFLRAQNKLANRVTILETKLMSYVTLEALTDQFNKFRDSMEKMIKETFNNLSR